MSASKCANTFLLSNGQQAGAFKCCPSSPQAGPASCMLMGLLPRVIQGFVWVQGAGQHLARSTQAVFMIMTSCRSSCVMSKSCTDPRTALRPLHGPLNHKL